MRRVMPRCPAPSRPGTFSVGQAGLVQGTLCGSQALEWAPATWPVAVRKPEDSVMASIFYGMTDAMIRRRRCAKCGKQQVVPREKVNSTVRCIKCGTDVRVPARRVALPKQEKH